MSISPPIKLLLLTDSKRFNTQQAMLNCIDQAMQGGVDTIVLREKHLDSAKLLSLASKLRVITHNHGVRLMIHSQADVAKAVSADGVHVDGKSISEIKQIKQWLGDGFMVSASCHDKGELKHAEQQGADFCFLSPVFLTQSHPGAPSLGEETFLHMAASVPIPVLALGGIEPDVISLLQGHGVAIMGGILNADNPKQAAKDLLLGT
ncbi:MAG: thiamine phosphate synthase [Zetaproteobacteria bacterium]|nr:MAG: thiamine phosphate synthase [Zetaproteobacteria bacterium]